MKRDPREVLKREYRLRTKIKTIHPIFFYHRCIGCGQEYKLETMYECTIPCVAGDCCILEHCDTYVQGCDDCFKSEDEFKQFLIDKELLNKDLI